MANFNAKIKIDGKELQQKIRYALGDIINDAAIVAQKPIENRLKQLIRFNFLQSPETLSMVAGRLQGDFGFTSGEAYVIPVIDWIVNRIRVDRVPYSLRGGVKKKIYKISLAYFDLDELTSLPTASYLNNVNVRRNIDWLEWLLTRGNKPIIYGYEADFGGYPRSRSRSGIAIMVRSDKNWRVPSQFSGTIRNNWITRVYKSSEQSVLNIIEDEFIKGLP